MAKKQIKEDAPTMSMAGGGIATRPLALGGHNIQVIRRQLLSTVLGKVRARLRTKRK